MNRFIGILIVVGGMSIAIANVRVVPGGLVEEMGTGYWIKGITMLHIDLSAPAEVRGNINYVITELQSARNQLKEVLNDGDLSALSYIRSGFSKWKLPQALIIALIGKIERAQAATILLANSGWLKSQRPESGRVRRGLVDLGGKILKTLFGVAHEDDIKALEHRIHLFDAKFEAQTALSEAIVEKLQENHNRIKGIEARISNITKMNEMQAADIELLYTLSQMSLVIDAFNDFVERVSLVKLEVEETMTAVLMGEIGHLGRSLLPFPALKAIVDHAKGELKMEPLIPLTEDSMNLFLETAGVTPGLDSTTLIIAIPFADFTHSYNVIKMIPFPTPRGDVRVIMEEKEGIYFVSRKFAYIAVFKEEKFESCQHFIVKRQHFCFPTVLAYKMQGKLNCLQKLLSSRVMDTFVNCPLREFESKEPRQILLAGKRFLSLYREQRGILECGELAKPIELKLLNRVDAECEIRTARLKLTKVTSLEDKITLTKLRSSDLSMATIHYPTEPPEYSSMPVYSTKGWKQIEILLNKTKATHATNTYWDKIPHHYVHYGIGTFLIFVTMIILIMFIVKQIDCKCRHRSLPPLPLPIPTTPVQACAELARIYDLTAGESAVPLPPPRIALRSAQRPFTEEGQTEL